MRKIVIKTIPHNKQRYETSGDYWIDKKGTLQVRISEMNDRYEFLVAVHEIIEQFLSEQRGIKGRDIDKFDFKFEKDREKGKHRFDDEPGDDKKAPYYKEHQFATGIERVLANELGVDWKEYDTDITQL